MFFSAVPPSAPVNLTLDSFGKSWVAFLWFQIPSEIVIESHIISVSGGGMEWDITIDGDQSTLNVTDLLPGTEYEFRITAVASDGQTSPQSTALVVTTRSRLLGIYVIANGLDIVLHMCFCTTSSIFTSKCGF